MRAWARLLAAIALFLAILPPGEVRGEIRLLGDWTYLWSQSEVEDEGLEQDRDSTVHGFDQIYRLDIRKQLYPTLLITGGVLAEDDSLTSEASIGDETEIASRTVRPYIDAELVNKLYRLAAGYRESEIRTEIEDQERTLYFEEYDLRGDWQPAGLPSLEGEYAHTRRYDDPLTVKQETDFYRISTRYDWKAYDFAYDYLRSDETREIRESETALRTHSGRLRYARRLMDDRINLHMRAQVQRTSTEFSGNADRVVPALRPGTGFYLLEDTTPGANTPVDDFIFVPPGSFGAVNLGPGNLAQPVSLGLSFGDETRVDRVRVFIRTDPADPLLASPAQIEAVSRLFRWRAFISEDRETWEERTISGVIYDPVENYFEIHFSPEAATEFVKVTTTPLDLVDLPGGEDIEVASVQAFFSLSQEEGDEVVSLSRIFSAGAGWAVTERTTLGYTLSYQDLEVDAFEQDSRQLTNGVNVTHRFTPILTGLGRILRSDEWDQEEHDTTVHSYSAQLVARYLPTLVQTLTYSGTHVDEPEGVSRSNSIYLRTNAELYRGWDATLDTGYSWQEDPNQGETSSYFLRIQNRIAPHPRYSLIADYSLRWLEQEERGDTLEQVGRLRGYWSPTDAISLVGDVSHRDTELGELTSWQFSANWLPFRDGTLQTGVSYSEEGTSEDLWRRSLSPYLIWRISRHIVLNLTYSLGQQEIRDTKADFQTARANLRVYYF